MHNALSGDIDVHATAGGGQLVPFAQGLVEDALAIVADAQAHPRVNIGTSFKFHRGFQVVGTELCRRCCAV